MDFTFKKKVTKVCCTGYVKKVPHCYKSSLSMLQKFPMLPKYPFFVTKVPLFRYKSAGSYGSLSLSLFYSFLGITGYFQFFEGLCGWNNSNQSILPWKEAVGLDMAASTNQVKSYLQSKGRNSKRGC